MNSHLRFFLIVSLVAIQACTPPRLVPASLNYKNYPVTGNLEPDSSVLRMISFYSDSVNKKMDQVIGFAVNSLNKRQPEGVLGNFFTDAMMEMAARRFNRKVDVAVMNPGGIRSYVSPGDITVGKIYQLMPFDNLLVLQEIKGSVLKAFLDHTASSGGWPVKGITMQIKNRKAVNIFIEGKPLDENAVYTMANSDYLANGGDYSEMLRPVPQLNLGYLFRDALIEYVQQLTKEGKPVSANLENRVSNAN
jgi:2',3'-cyclic-nucleotide 2'-phosphodiesterase (5'-nucleotidase family)